MLQSHPTDHQPLNRPTESTDAAAMTVSQGIVAAILTLTGLSLLLPLVSLGGWMLGRDYYQHFPLLLIAAAGLAAIRIRQDRPAFVGLSSARVLFWTLAAVAIATTVFVLPSRWMASLGGTAVLIAAVHFYGGREFARRMIGPLVLVTAAIPLPVNFDSWFVVALQQLATWLASVWLDLANVLHFTTGVAIQTAGQEYHVEDACSGIHSVFAAIGVGVGYAAIRRYAIPRVLVCVIQLLFWVVIANALRVFLTIYGQSEWGLDLSHAVSHEVLGLLTFAAAILLGLSGDHLLRYIQPLRNWDDLWPATNWEQSEAKLSAWLDRPAPARFVAVTMASLALVAMMVGLSFFRYTANVKAPMSMRRMAELAVLDLQELDEDFLPEEIAGWKRSGFRKEGRDRENIFGGMVSLVWQYSNGDRRLLLSLDGPYSDWHDLSLCYRGVGWDVDGMELVEAGSEREPFVASQLMLQRGPLESAQVLFGCVDPAGRDVSPPRSLEGTQYFGGALARLVGRFGIGVKDRPEFEGGVVQLQLLDRRAGAIDRKTQAENMQLFRAAIEQAFID